MRADLIVFGHPSVEIDLQFVNAEIDLLAEDDATKLVEYGLVKALDDAVV
jgi:hypothetical protein